ncbi:DUF916 and DUF3324 domain-containing protein [Lacticaseibacillus jixianensis]|uniref:DUF916 and DUF3324 domain-containing protein n=1 Tax=Lacticaseibacillus jixianensis TaxID=2486012 RepID=A0ABW4BAC3_9LACO|nr:DUF916 and DUF3324 domain-containing protein [Lacticaseibacillus jixianensis]
MLKKFLYWLTGMVALIGIAPAVPVAAANGASFSIKPVFTDAASAKENYFDLLVRPGQTISLPVNVTNVSGVATTVRVSVADAYTGDNGQVGYAPNHRTDDSAQYRLSVLASAPVTLKLAKGATKQAKFTVQVPKGGFKGELVGSLYAADPKAYGGSGSGLSLKNKFAMYTAIVLRTSPQYVSPDLKLRQVKVGIQNGQAAVLATLQNYRPQMFGQMSVHTKVYQAGSKKPVLTRDVSGYAMAPNSHFNFGTMTDHAFTAGRYTLDLLATSGTRRWHFRRQFQVTQKQAADVNRAASLKMAAPFPWWLLILVIGLALLVLLLIFLLWRRRKQDREEASK